MCRGIGDRNGIPVVILLAVNATVLGEAGELGLEGQLTFTALQAPQVPLFVHGQQVVPVGDLAPAAGAQSGLLWAQRGHALQRSARARSGRRPAVPRGSPAQRQPSRGVRERGKITGLCAKTNVGKTSAVSPAAPFLQRRLPEPGVRALRGFNLKTTLPLEPFSKGHRLQFGGCFRTRINKS